RLPRRRARERGRRPAPGLRVRGRRAVRARLGREARPAAAARGGGGAGGWGRVRGGGRHHHRHHDSDGGAATQPRDRHHAARGRNGRFHPPTLPAPGSDQGDAGRLGRDRVVLRGVRADQPLAHPGGVLYPRAGGNGRHRRDADRAGRERDVGGTTSAQSMNGVKREGVDQEGVWTLFCLTLFCLTLFCLTPLVAQRPPPFDQQLRDNQRRLEDIRRERSQVEQELERLRTQAHSLTDELSNIELQKETTNRIVNELYRQINGLTSQIDRITVDLLLGARDALGRRRTERGDELQRYVSLEHARQASLVETRRSAREAEQRLSSLERDERSLNDRIAALERARREAEARGAATAAAT